jgi:hypothetical protein
MVSSQNGNAVRPDVRVRHLVFSMRRNARCLSVCVAYCMLEYPAVIKKYMMSAAVCAFASRQLGYAVASA